MTLEEKLKSFKIPALRQDLEKLENVIWLARNLPIKNLDNSLLNEVMEEINKLAKKTIKFLIK